MYSTQLVLLVNSVIECNSYLLYCKMYFDFKFQILVTTISDYKNF